MRRQTVTSLEEGLDALRGDDPPGLRVVVADAVPAWLPALAEAAAGRGANLLVSLEPTATFASDDARAGWEIGALTVVLAAGGTVVDGVDEGRVRRVQAIVDRLAVAQEASA